MNELNVFSPYIPSFLLVFLRLAIFVAFLPFFSSKTFPMRFKIGLVVAMAMVITPVVDIKYSTENIPMLVIKEVLLGIILGSVARSVFFAVDMAAQTMSMSIGMALGSVYNPEMGQTTTELSRFYTFLSMLIFVALDAHHDIIYVFVKSYELVPSGKINIDALFPKLIAEGSKLFVVAIKISAPVVLGMLVTNIILGFISKASPQINLFSIGFALYMVIGFSIIILTLPLFIDLTGAYFRDMRNDMELVLRVAGI